MAFPILIIANDFRLVKKYMLLYDVGVPKYVILSLFVILTGVIVALYLKKQDRDSFLRYSSLTLLLGYTVFVLCTTVIFRECSDEARCYLFPFWSYDILNYKLIAQLVLNVLMFIPIGFLIGAAAIEITFVQTIKLGCFLSVAIEAVQYFSRRGVCNIDDVIHNTLGCSIGYGVFRLCSFLRAAYIDTK